MIGMSTQKNSCFCICFRRQLKLGWTRPLETGSVQCKKPCCNMNGEICNYIKPHHVHIGSFLAYFLCYQWYPWGKMNDLYCSHPFVFGVLDKCVKCNVVPLMESVWHVWQYKWHFNCINCESHHQNGVDECFYFFTESCRRKKIHQQVGQEKKTHQPVGQEKKNSSAGWPGNSTQILCLSPPPPCRSSMVRPMVGLKTVWGKLQVTDYFSRWPIILWSYFE